jgi:hypothetical protein
MKKLFLGFVFLLAAAFANAQDLQYARSTDSILTSPRFGGRGYVDKGEHIAAEFIAGRFKPMVYSRLPKTIISLFLFR